MSSKAGGRATDWAFSATFELDRHLLLRQTHPERRPDFPGARQPGEEAGSENEADDCWLASTPYGAVPIGPYSWTRGRCGDDRAGHRNCRFGEGIQPALTGCLNRQVSLAEGGISGEIQLASSVVRGT